MKNWTRTTILLVALAFLATSCSRTPKVEEFPAFLSHFIQDRTFAATRIEAPVTVLLDPSEVPRAQEHWSVQDVLKKMTWPLAPAQLNGRVQDIHGEADSTSLSQYETDTDGYRFEYFFKRKDGAWYLVEYRDDRV